MVYASYEYYRGQFGGSAIPEEWFSRCMDFAGRKIEYFTFGRIKDPEGVDGLRDCACEMAEAVYSLRYKKDGKEKKSESIDGYSVSYVTEQKDGEDTEAFLGGKLYSICSAYLMHTGLMYRGVVC